MEDAFRTAYGFLPVRVEPPLPTKLFVPEDLSLSFIIRLERLELAGDYFPLELVDLLLEEELVLEEVLPLLGGPRIFNSG